MGAHVWDKCRPEKPANNRTLELEANLEIIKHVFSPGTTHPLSNTHHHFIPEETVAQGN